MQMSTEINELATALTAAQAEIDSILAATAKKLGVTGEWVRYFIGRYRPGPSGCLEWKFAVDVLGYARTRHPSGENKVHRISWVLQNGTIPASKKILHSCDNRRCVNPFHLSVGTQADNVADMMERGRFVAPTPMYGERNPQARVNAAIVEAVRSAVLAGERQCDIARRMNLRPMHVSRIVRREVWGHI